MRLTDGTYAFPQTVEQGGVETTIHPAAVETPKGVLLIDTGYPNTADQIESNLADANFDWEDVHGVLVTHHDGDHAGALEAVVDRTDAVVYAHEQCARYVDGRAHPIKSPEGDRYPPVDVDVQIVDDVSFRTAAGPMDVVFTPGHTPGHVSLHFPEAGLLLAADALTADEEELAGPSEQYTPKMEEALESAERLSERDIDRILCYHGGLVEADSDRISEVVASVR